MSGSLSVGAEDGRPAVIVNTWERISVERWILLTAAHELGHLILHLSDYDVSQTEEDPAQEPAGRHVAAASGRRDLDGGVACQFLRRSMTRRAEVLRPQPAVPKVARPAGR